MLYDACGTVSEYHLTAIQIELRASDFIMYMVRVCWEFTW